MEAFIDRADELSRPENVKKYSKATLKDHKTRYIDAFESEDIWIDASGHIHFGSNIVQKWSMARLECLLDQGWSATIIFDTEDSNVEECRIYREPNSQEYTISFGDLGDITEMFDSYTLFLEGAAMFFKRIRMSHEDPNAYLFTRRKTGGLAAFLTAAKVIIKEMVKS